MKKNLFSAFTLLYCCFTVSSQSINTKKLDDYFSLIADNNRAIGTIVISQNGQQLYNRQFGKQGYVSAKETSAKTKYQIGSVTKMLTATMIFQLVDQKKLSLDEKLSNYFPEVPNAKNISISHLLSHTSGLGDFVIKEDSLVYWLRKPVSEAEIFSEIKRQGSLFEPGTQTEYSNTGYYLLTHILEKKYKKDYKTIFDDNIVKPLNLKDTRSINKKDKGQDIAISYAFSDKWTPIEDFYFPNVIGVGDVVSTPEDMNTFLIALYSHKVISKESLEKMKPAENEGFGKGLMKLPFYSHAFYGHLGDTMGTHTMSLYNPVDGLTFTVMLTGMELDRNDYLIAILSIMYDMNYTLPDFNRYNIDSLQLRSYEGVYAGADLPLKVKIFVNDNILNAQATGQQAFPLEAVDTDKFRFIQAGIEMEFNNSEKTMTLIQRGKTYILKRE